MQTSQQASEWHLPTEPKPKNPRQSQSKVKVMLTVFFDYCGVVHSEFLPEGQTINKVYYLSILWRLRDLRQLSRFSGQLFSFAVFQVFTTILIKNDHIQGHRREENKEA
ncbi:hypothetical protein K1T71_005631 [Dendrolimus kikuchii]|uniref:Uncharacterized protein n=1 Tax=Dendrolimus kikuchii TaxID=765133 RepID=A0ACC1D4S3_9NEOP|nr:hypothetical protein K1T71_005631 [Dendrolimus kikuchii]